MAVVNSPLVHLGGLFRILQCVTDGRRFVLLERFSVGSWSDAVRKYRPRTVSLVPTALRMVLESDIEKDVLSSVKSVVSGTAPLSPDDAEAFTARFGVPVLVSYAATEFGGGVAGWNLEDHRAHWGGKRGSVGRAHSGTQIRVVDESTGDELGPGDDGVLEVKASQLGAATWIRTTDQARIDDDGFLFILGRCRPRDDPRRLQGDARRHQDRVERLPDVRGASVVGVDDRRLGQVPVAAVELRPGSAVEASALVEQLAPVLAPYERPAEIRLVDELPVHRLGEGRPDRGRLDVP